MCGILLTYGVEQRKLSSTLDKLHNRGPYNRGEVHINDVGVGMVQLPMKAQHVDALPVKHKSYYVSYNGEIYDERATNLYNEVEIAIDSINNLTAINGMFAMACYDTEKNEIILARDEFGIKPLYYYCNRTDNIFIACSEIYPILTIIGTTTVNRMVMSEILVFGTQADEATCFSDIYLLKPGDILNINLCNMEIRRKTLPTFKPLLQDLDSILEKSITACVGDTFRPASLLLSDGLDSNLLLTYLHNDINKYNIIVNNNDLEVNKKKYTQLKQTHLHSENFLNYFAKAIGVYGQPCRMTSVLMYQALSEYIGQHNSHLVITGEGADEIFWGYPRYLKPNMHLIDKSDIINIFFPNLFPSISLLGNEEQKEHIHEKIVELSASSDNVMDIIFSFDKKFSLEPLLRRSDHLLMANTIETRVPFLHFGIPLLAKEIGLNRIKEGINKAPLIDLIKKRNASYSTKIKSHFRAPIIEWFGIKNLDEHFNGEQLELLDYFGVSVDKLRLLSNELISTQLFVLKTMVVWYEKFSRHLN